jgi:RNA polymerase sigma-70 factor (ECF subfamily)
MLRDPQRFKPWIMRILSNTSNEMLRKRKNNLPIEDMDEHLSSDEKDLCSSISLWDAVKSLNKDYHSVVVLFYYEDMSIKDISTITGLSQGTVRTRLTRARQQLKILLSKGELL